MLHARECLGGKPEREMKVKADTLRGHRRPSLKFTEGLAVERVRCDPKDGELFLRRAKPEETLVEARSGSDVQIDRRTWV